MDGLIGVEAEVKLKFIASHIVTKWKEPYSHTCVYVNSRVLITLDRATHFCIQGYRVLASQISVKHPQWEDGAGLHLFG